MKRHMLNVTMTLAAALAVAIPAAAQNAGVAAAAQAAQERAAAAADLAAQGAAVAATIDPAAIARAVEMASQTVWTTSKIDTAALERAAEKMAAFSWTDQSGDNAPQRAAEDAAREKERAQREKEREGSYYEQGQNALDSGRWDRAVSSFDRVIEMKGAKSDAALYWKAYAQNKQGQRPEALATLGVLTKDYPRSRYLNDAKALEVEVKNNAGQPINVSDSDEETKLIVLSQMEPSDEVVPVLQKLLQGNSSPRVKAKALFVLAQGSSPKARDVLMSIAKGGSNPDLQMKAVQYLGVHGGRENRAALAEIYTSSSDVDLKKRILNSFMVAGDKERVLAAAQSEQNPELRASAVQQLGVMGATTSWAISESRPRGQKNIIRAMFVGSNATRLTEVARTDSDPELRLAVRPRRDGQQAQRRHAVGIYASDKDPDVKKAVVNGLFVGGNVDQLVALARKEQDPALKKDIVSKLSNMHSKVATDYLLEILNK